MRALPHQRGNILFLILLAIILFVALSYAIMGQRDGSKNASSEKVQTQAAEILQKATLVENTIQRLMLVNGCKDTEISFENPTVANYVNPNANAAGMNKKCHLFDPAGGGLSFPSLPRDAFDPALESLSTSWGIPVFSGVIFVTNVGTDCAAGNCVELTMTASGLTKALCDNLNDKLGISATLTNGSFAAFEPNPVEPDYFKGTYYYYSGAAGIYASQTALLGRRSGCQKRQDLSGGGNPYVFYHVLLAR